LFRGEEYKNSRYTTFWQKKRKPEETLLKTNDEDGTRKGSIITVKRKDCRGKEGTWKTHRESSRYSDLGGAGRKTVKKGSGERWGALKGFHRSLLGSVRDL